jgi:hypothetical protein
MRIALRGMTVPEELLRLRKLRLSASPAPANGQTPAERGLVGHPALVVVAIALADLIIEAAARHDPARRRARIVQVSKVITQTAVVGQT